MLAAPPPPPGCPPVPRDARIVQAQMVGNASRFRMAVHRSHDIVSLHLQHKGEWQSHVLTLLAPYLDAETTFVDIGANIGWYSFLAASRSRRVVAFEAFENNARLFSLTSCLNPSLASNVLLRRVGLSSRKQVCALYTEPSNFGDAQAGPCRGTAAELAAEHAPSSRQDPGGHTFVRKADIRMETLDSEASPELLAARKVLKMDVEGHEPEVLKGAATFFTTGRPPVAVVAEVNCLAKNSSFFADMRRWGYVTATCPGDRGVGMDQLFVREQEAGGKGKVCRGPL